MVLFGSNCAKYFFLHDFGGRLSCRIYGRYRVDYINYVLKLNVTSGQRFVYYNQNLIFLNQASFMKRKGDSIDTIKLTLRHYKQSYPAEPVNMLFLSDSTSLPCQSISGILKFKGNLWPGPLFCWPDLSPISRNFFTQALADPLRFCDLDVSGYKSHSFRIRQPPGQLPTACLMPRLGDGNLMPFSGKFVHLQPSSWVPYAYNL